MKKSIIDEFIDAYEIDTRITLFIVKELEADKKPYLSGMIQNSKTNFSNGIPCLGGLPVVGALFAQNDRSATKTNVIIFVRPIIINSFEDYDRITEEEEAMFKENAVKQVLKEEFDQATEMIKALSEE